MLSLFRRKPSAADAARALVRYGVAEKLCRDFANYVASGAPAALWHANPRYLAEQLRSSERDVLRLLLGAVHEGLVRLHWEVQCPKCGAVAHRGDTITRLEREGECPMCHGVFPQRLDVEVRVTCSIQPPWRTLSSADDDPEFRKAIDDRLGWVSGQELLLLPDFQKLFPLETLLPGESLEVARTAFVFTDLAGSTALYASRGDPRAFHLVRQHFDALFTVAERQRGTVVKTIGDAVMAAFQNPADALAAGLGMQNAIANLNSRLGLATDEQLLLKVGLHSGPCLNVTLNDRPDYFGTTVNVAARVQGLSLGSDVVFTDVVYENDTARSLLANPPNESWRTPLKGISGEVHVHRLVL